MDLFGDRDSNRFIQMMYAVDDGGKGMNDTSERDSFQ